MPGQKVLLVTQLAKSAQQSVLASNEPSSNQRHRFLKTKKILSPWDATRGTKVVDFGIKISWNRYLTFGYLCIDDTITTRSRKYKLGVSCMP